MDLGERINQLSDTELPDDLLKLLFNAKVMVSQEQYIRANSVLNVIEAVCKKRGIVIMNGYRAPKMFDGQGRLVDVKI